MLNIVNAKDLNYTSKGPVVSLTHLIGKKEVEDIIRLAVEAWGPAFVHEVLGLKEEDQALGYMVFVEGGACPQHVHGSNALATEEAVRLSTKTQRGSYVFKLVNKVSVERKVIVEVKTT